MEKRQLTLINKLGLHARASMKLVDLATRFSAKITIQYKQSTVDAKSIMNMMVLGVACGQTIEVSATGDDEKAAIDAIAGLVNDRFGESE